MNKIWLIIQREYTSRVFTKTFLLATFLTPIGIAFLGFIAGKIMSYESGEIKKIAILDESTKVQMARPDTINGVVLIPVMGSLEDIKKEVTQKKYEGVLYIPKGMDSIPSRLSLKYYSDNEIVIDTKDAIEESMLAIFRNEKMKRYGIEESQIKQLETKLEIDPDPIEKKQNFSSMRSGIATVIGMIMGLVMYLSVFIYGSMVMRSVAEEKTSRIVEVMISSVKPFQLMMGKIIGVGAVGLTQLAIWMVTIPLLTGLVAALTGVNSSPQSVKGLPGMPSQDAMNQASQMGNGKAAEILMEISQMPWGLMVPLFLIYFLLGYLLYSALFAAVGSAIDDVNDSQSLVMPITIPVIISVYIMIRVVRDPMSDMGVWASIFPLFSPIVMPARLAFQPPWWQIALSLILLIAFTLLLIWIASRIYRVGILMYGKKATWKEIGKWIMMKE
jgi:ABC-2 type transport system permease protein